MPELPEIQHLRQSLNPWLIGARVAMVRVYRPDVIRIGCRRCSEATPTRLLSRPLLKSGRIIALHRLGKQLAVETDIGSVICVHLGMSGRLSYVPAGVKLPAERHIHVIWRLEGVRGVDAGHLYFQDPRRFGGIWCFSSMDELGTVRWNSLGPDALEIKTAQLAPVLGQTHRPIKAVLLDQRLIAGVGNIYADEALFAARIHPRREGCSLRRSEIRRLTDAIRATLRRSVAAGGTTIRDYRDGLGEPGAFARSLRVYGMANQACSTCGQLIESEQLAQRTTHFCPRCQPLPGAAFHKVSTTRN